MYMYVYIIYKAQSSREAAVASCSCSVAAAGRLPWLVSRFSTGDMFQFPSCSAIMIYAACETMRKREKERERQVFTRIRTMENQSYLRPPRGVDSFC